MVDVEFVFELSRGDEVWGGDAGDFGVADVLFPLVHAEDCVCVGALARSDRVEAFELEELAVFAAVVAFVHERRVWILCTLPARLWRGSVEDSVCLGVCGAECDVCHDVLLVEPLDGGGGRFFEGEFQGWLGHVCVCKPF